MWLYFNDRYDCTTAIYHGQVIRQGNSFDLYLCFPNKSTNLNLNPICQFALRSISSVTAGIPQTNEYWGSVVTFERVETGEYIGDFKVGEKYICYHIYVPSYQGITENYGNVPFTIHVKKNDTEIIGSKSLYVQKTYGNTDTTTINVSEYNNLVALISQFSTMSKYQLEFDTSKIIDKYGLGLTIYVYQKLAFVSGMFMVNTDLSSEDGFVRIAINDTGNLKIAYDSFIHGIVVENERDTQRNGTDVELRLSVGTYGVELSVSSAVVKEDDVIAVTGMAMMFVEEQGSAIGDSSLVEIHNLNELTATGKYLCNDSTEPTGFPSDLLTYTGGYLYEVINYVSNGIVYVKQTITTTDSQQAIRLASVSDIQSGEVEWHKVAYTS